MSRPTTLLLLLLPPQSYPPRMRMLEQAVRHYALCPSVWSIEIVWHDRPLAAAAAPSSSSLSAVSASSTGEILPDARKLAAGLPLQKRVLIRHEAVPSLNNRFRPLRSSPPPGDDGDDGEYALFSVDGAKVIVSLHNCFPLSHHNCSP